jgi:hypothetical protein
MKALASNLRMGLTAGIAPKMKLTITAKVMDIVVSARQLISDVDMTSAVKCRLNPYFSFSLLQVFGSREKRGQ